MLMVPNSDLLREKAYIGGRWVNAISGNQFDVVDPATGDHLATVPDMGEEDTLLAITHASEALNGWNNKTSKERAGLLKAWHHLILERKSDLARLLTAEQGKPLAEAEGEIAYGAAYIEWFAEEARRIYGDVIPSPSSDRRLLTIKQAIGVVGIITPWNFPNAMITRKLAPALAAGCTVIVKPSEETPISALALAALAEEAGIPEGVINVLTTTNAAAIGGVLTQHDDVRKLSFTGSTQVGRMLMRDCASTVKKVSLELGGNAPFIVFDDADLDTAVAGAIASKYRNAGQTCVCANRILVQAGIHDAFVAKFASAVSELRTGNGFSRETTIGPLINDNAKRKVASLVRQAVRQGADLLVGGAFDENNPACFEPTILTDVTASMSIASEEIFGPVAPIFRFNTEDEAISLANDTPFGLAAYFYTQDIGRAWRVSEALEYGMVGLNEGILSTETAPFGGIKQSGIGREGSRYGIEDYVELKYLCMGGLNASS